MRSNAATNAGYLTELVPGRRIEIEAALASQKRHDALFLCGVACLSGGADVVREAFAATGLRLGMGVGCARFGDTCNLAEVAVAASLRASPRMVRHALLASGLAVAVMLLSMPLALLDTTFAITFALTVWLVLIPFRGYMYRQAPES